MKRIIPLLLVAFVIFMSLGIGFACEPEPDCCWTPPRCMCRVHKPCNPCSPPPMPRPMPGPGPMPCMMP